MVGSTVKKTMGISNRWAESNGIYTALNDLSREIMILMAKNHLTSEDLDNILNDVHHRLSLIEDRSPLIQTEDGKESQSAMFSIDIHTHSPQEHHRSLFDEEHIKDKYVKKKRKSLTDVVIAEENEVTEE